MVRTEYKFSFTEIEIPQKTTAIIVAAGNASRMDGIDKQLAPILGIPVIERSVKAFQEAAVIDSIVLVAREDKISEFQNLLSDKYSKITDIIAGGSSRAESVKHGIEVCDRDTGIVLIHDGARPLVTDEIITAVKNAAELYGAAACAVPLKDTVKKIDLSGRIVETPRRSSLVSVQTPQGFRMDIYKKALQSVDTLSDEITDDCSLIELSGNQVYTVKGSYDNIKITTPIDITLAEAIIKRREEEKCE